VRTPQAEACRAMKRIIRWFVASALILVIAIAVVVWFGLRASLPRLEGQVRVAGLSAAATIERDHDGTPTITARTREDLAFATGFAHAQDRFFQMDLMRRAAAGELAELLGPTLLDTDKRFRVHGFRQVARTVIDDASAADRALLGAYVEGVNAGLRDLNARPWEYQVLRADPVAWRLEDSMLAAFSMYLNLNDSTGEEELARSHLREVLPPEVFAFLNPLGTEWDAPIVGGIWRGPPLPTPEIFDMRRRATQVAAVPASLDVEEKDIVGSNSWAVAGTHAANGGALLANDMHLGLRLPNVWYRARLIVEGTGEEARDLIGVTLPGLPVLVVGSNRHVAWGYTNSYGDWTDLIVVETDPADPSKYFVGDTTQAITTRRESIAVRGGASVAIDVQSTRWGPIVKRDAQGRPLALAWTAHHPSATNLRLFDFEAATTVKALLDAANTAGGPVQNVLAADSTGAIGWSLMGRVPVRANYDSTQPASWRSSGTGWVGWHEPNEYPRVVDPSAGRLWTANTRTIDAQTWLDFMGDGGHDLGARAAQIRDDLLAIQGGASAADLAKIQTDDRALFLVRWHDLLMDLLNDTALANAPLRKQARELVERWSARASADDVGYRIVRAFRLRVRKDVFDAFTAPAREKYPQTQFAPSPQFEGPLWHLVTQRPEHLLDPRYKDWNEALLAALDAALESLQAECKELSKCTWGQQNTLQMRHPLSSALPFASRWLDMPTVPLPGDAAMPRVQGTQFGASERMVVSPGKEDEGVFQMPGGPVDHPLSPFYGAGHAAWARGEPQPFLPGPPLHRLELAPAQ
jgi:penicillin amidase